MSDPVLADSLLDNVPEPNVVRGLIQKSIRRTAMLRQLLKLAERKHQDADRGSLDVDSCGQGVSRAS